MHSATLPADHLEYLNRRPFAFGCSTSIFPEDERQALAEVGNWLQALASGAIEPLTPEHEHFLRVDRELEEPSTLWERAWVRLKGRREYEQEQNQRVPSQPEEDYGMVEFDADRCWW